MQASPNNQEYSPDCCEPVRVNLVRPAGPVKVPTGGKQATPVPPVAKLRSDMRGAKTDAGYKGCVMVNAAQPPRLSTGGPDR